MGESGCKLYKREAMVFETVMLGATGRVWEDVSKRVRKAWIFHVCWTYLILKEESLSSKAKHRRGGWDKGKIFSNERVRGPWPVVIAGVSLDLKKKCGS